MQRVQKWFLLKVLELKGTRSHPQSYVNHGQVTEAPWLSKGKVTEQIWDRGFATTLLELALARNPSLKDGVSVTLAPYLSRHGHEKRDSNRRTSKKSYYPYYPKWTHAHTYDHKGQGQ